ncbi:MAG: alkaline phytoceramidase [Pseudomonadota bacterium]|nr:alkaline phytoceramidase [Pseudomonadota bacterium]
MNRRARLVAIGVLTLAVVVTLGFVSPIPQDPSYHAFADRRAWLGVPNLLDVASNAPFLVVGALGVGCLWGGRARFIDPRERWPYLVFYGAIFFTGLGSAYYHLAPDNARLLWDRLPLAAGFAAVLAAVIAERIDVRAGLLGLGPLLMLAIGSVLYWDWSERAGQGDLRPYGVVQFYSGALIALILVLYPSAYTRSRDPFVMLGLYALAKLCEWLDRPIFAALGGVSGHTLKHLVAGVAVFWLLRMLRLRAPLTSRPGAFP